MKEPITELEQVVLNKSAISFLKEIAKWSKFLSIMGFIGIALMIVFAIFAGAIYNSMPSVQATPFDMATFMSVFYFIFAAVYFFPVYYLFQFANKMTTALNNKDNDTLTNAFEMLKSHYKFIGVFTIILLSLYAFAIIIALIVAAF